MSSFQQISARIKSVVSSRGCCKSFHLFPKPSFLSSIFFFSARSFIICILSKILDYIRRYPSVHSYPFPKDLIEKWLLEAKLHLSRSTDFSYKYGTKFNPSDIRTFWTKAEQFNTWSVSDYICPYICSPIAQP